MRNHINNKCMVRGPEFQPPTICQRVDKYNTKHRSTPKVPPKYWKPNPLIS